VSKLARRVQALEAMVRDDDAEVAREAPRRYFKGGSIICMPQADGAYMTRGELLLTNLLDGPQTNNAAGRGSQAALLSSDGCAGAILHVDNGFHGADRGAGGIGVARATAKGSGVCRGALVSRLRAWPRTARLR